MSWREKVKAEEKAELARRCVEGEESVSGAAQRVGVNRATVRDWMARYEAEGAAGFLPYERNRSYSVELKRQAVEEYLSGAGSSRIG